MGDSPSVHQHENEQTNVVYLYNTIHSVIKCNRLLINNTTWTNLKSFYAE